MSAFKINIDQFETPYKLSPEELLLEGGSSEGCIVPWHSTDAFVYDCIMKAKSVFKTDFAQNGTVLWLLPALPFQSELKTLFATSLQQCFGTPLEHLFFEGCHGIHSALMLAQQSSLENVTVIAIDGVFKANKREQFDYLGVAACTANIEFINTGWVLQSAEMVASIDLAKHNPIQGELKRVLSLNEQPIDIIFAPGNGVESDDWLNYLPVLSNKINEQTIFQLPNYKLGKLGALEGIINLATLTNSPFYNDNLSQVLVITQESNKYQAVASYLWTSKEVCN